MKLKILVLSVLVMIFGLQGEDAAGRTAVANAAPAAVTVKDGYTMLNSLLTLFENLPATNGIGEVENRLSQLSKDAKSAREANVIDNIFFNRYRRMLMVFKLIVTPIIKNEMLEPIFMKTFTDFVWDVTYEHWIWGDKDSIGKMSAAMEEELVQLQFYLDTRQAREDFKKKMGKLLPPPAKKKSETK